MIISRTPFRVSLFGGGSDYPQWYRRHGGAVLGFAINKYCYISIRPLPPFFEHRHRFVYSKVECVNDFSEIQHPAIRAVLSDKGAPGGLEMHHDGDLPARSGLGSSSSFTVGLLNALAAMDGRMVSKKKLADDSIRIEQEVIGENVGSQDQIWAAYGGMNRINFRQGDGGFDVAPLVVHRERRNELVGKLMLFFTGFSRFATEIAGKQIANFGRKERHIQMMTAMVDQAAEILNDRRCNLAEIGKLLHASWQLKRELADVVSTPQIDEIYEAAREAGAVGGKLLGAGGGGFMLFYVEPHLQNSVRARLSKLVEVGFDIDDAGSKIVVYEPYWLNEQ